MSDTFFHGARVTEVTEGARDLQARSTSIIAIVGTAPDADVDLFPVDTPVLVTDLPTAITDLGADGTLSPALEAIFQITTPIVVIVRVTEGEGAEAAADTLENIIGAAGPKTGLYALLGAEAAVGVKPKILGVPGFGAETVTAALAIVAKKLNAFGYAGCDTADTIAEAVTYREEFSDREIMLIYGDFSSGDAIARALGMRAYLDETQGWHKSLSNVAVPGVTGAVPALHFDLQDPSSESGVLNAAAVTCIVQRNGYRFWGNRTCSDDPKFAFEPYVRTAQVLRETIADGLMWAIDKPLHPTLARDILDTINNEFRQLKAQGRIIDGRAWLDPSMNTADTLAAGKLAIDYDYTPVPVLEDLELTQRITDRYLVGFADEVNGAA
ncbi:phage tail sheath subtilisin-like domain-containing protein [Brevundimonas sp. UBA7664]|uniref:phage tail sheath subtilisin-like domain-containing protein n=1 Tax=Brevundimonas sp. UBA7664 TaxID=1946141 RepID=UPI0025C70D1A|nr:phage tail sheath subtilisin-like domain-containing protein [Brevundimonas sp. UBA7664]